MLTMPLIFDPISLFRRAAHFIVFSTKWRLNVFALFHKMPLLICFGLLGPFQTMIVCTEIKQKQPQDREEKCLRHYRFLSIVARNLVVLQQEVGCRICVPVWLPVWQCQETMYWHPECESPPSHYPSFPKVSNMTLLLAACSARLCFPPTPLLRAPMFPLIRVRREGQRGWHDTERKRVSGEDQAKQGRCFEGCASVQAICLNPIPEKLGNKHGQEPNRAEQNNGREGKISRYAGAVWGQ